MEFMQTTVLNILTWMKVGYCESTWNSKHFTYMTCFIWMLGYLDMSNAILMAYMKICMHWICDKITEWKKKSLRAECNALCKAQDGPGPKWKSVCEEKLKGDSAEKGSPPRIRSPDLLDRCTLWRPLGYKCYGDKRGARPNMRKNKGLI